MKRKLIMLALSLALTVMLIPTLAAYADDGVNQAGTPNQVVQDKGENQDVPDSALDTEQGDEGQADGVAVDLPKLNLKSPVTQCSQTKIGSKITLVAKIGAKVIDPSLITWTSGDDSIATVSTEGIVTVVGVGKVTITAVMTDGSAQNGYAKIFVSAKKHNHSDTHMVNVGANHHDAVTHPANSNCQKHLNPTNNHLTKHFSRDKLEKIWEKGNQHGNLFEKRKCI